MRFVYPLVVFALLSVACVAQVQNPSIANLALYQDSIQKNPGNARLLSTLAILQEVLRTDKRWNARQRDSLEQESLKNYKKALTLDSTSEEANFNLGVYYFNLGVHADKQAGKNGKSENGRPYFEKALPYFERLYRLKPNEVEFRKPLIRVYNFLGRESEAKRLEE